MNSTKTWDCIVIGAGAAGLMASIQLALHKKSVLLLDSQENIGAKILMSGGTRCNVTNKVVTEKDYCSEQSVIVRNILRRYPPQESILFFNNIGVRLSEEKNGQCYPATQSAKTVLKALIDKLKKEEVELKTNTKVVKIIKKESIYVVYSNTEEFKSSTVIFATGGLSYPNTGSDGGGYRMAKKFNHQLISTTPALTPLKMNKNIWTSLMGISVNAVLTLWVDQKKYMQKDTSLLFTHFGISGLGVLDISRHWDRKREESNVKLTVSYLTDAKKKLNEYAKVSPKKTIKSFLNQLFPQRFSEAVSKYLKIDSSITVAQLAKDKRKDLVNFLECYELPVVDVLGYGKAEVTAGGISFKDITPKTLESKFSTGLFFCGEILDVDGRIGGFNFQWAWASGFVAAQGVNQYCETLNG